MRTCRRSSGDVARQSLRALKSLVNRIWFHLNGKGIVDPVDDFRDSNPSVDDDPLGALAKDSRTRKRSFCTAPAGKWSYCSNAGKGKIWWPS